MSNDWTHILQVPGKGLSALGNSLRYVKKAKLWLQVLIAMVLGIVVGLFLSPEMAFVDAKTSKWIGEWLALPGHLFLALIKMIVVPLIMASIVQGISAAVDLDRLKSMGVKVILFFLITTVIAVSIGIGVGQFVKPGSYINAENLIQSKEVKIELRELKENLATQEVSPVSAASIPKKVSNLLPDNPLNSLVEGEMLQIVIFAIIIGIGLLLLQPSSAKPLQELFGSIQEVSMAIVGLAMSFAPLAVFGLLAHSMIQTGPDVLTGMGVYTLAVIGALFLLFLVYLVLAIVLAQISPFRFIKAIREPALIGFSTSSSAATMPVSVKSAEDILDVPSSISQLVIPLGATINMGGTACYQGLTTLFMAQIFGLDLGTSALSAVIVTSVGASIGTPAVPGVGMIVLSGVLTSAGVPLAGLPLIIGLDRILERFRTSINVTGDILACSVMKRFSK